MTTDRHDQTPDMDRRTLLKAGVGLTFAFSLGSGLTLLERAAAATAAKINAYISIGPDGIITIMAPAAEMGQGVLTSLPLIMVEELDADWSKVKIEPAPVHPDYNHPVHRAQLVLGSLTVLGYWGPCRTAGAQARRVLLNAAAEHWGVPGTEVATQPSTVVHRPSGRKLTYGEIAAFAKVPAELPKINPADLKPVSEFRLLGKDVMRIDVPAKTNGMAQYAMDIDLPGMVYATVAHAPVRGSEPESFNADAIKNMPGIIDAIVLPEGVGIVGRTVPEVFAARGKLEVTWRKGAVGFSHDSERDLQEYLEHVRDHTRRDKVTKDRGMAPGAIQGVARVFAREYTNDYVYHAQMEPSTCTAWVKGDTAEIWSGTQWSTRSVEDSAKLLGIPAEKITFHQVQIGGGFGRRIFIDYVTEAVQISKAVGRPVKLIQTREDDLASGRFRAMAAQQVEAHLDHEGKIVGWRHRVAAEPVVPYVYSDARWKAQQGFDHVVLWGTELNYYAVPNQVTEHVYEERRASRLLKKSYRALSSYDFLAHSRGVVMRGLDHQSGSLFSYVDLEKRIRPDHPLRTIRRLVDDALASMDRAFADLYCEFGRPSVPPERLLRAMLLQAFYSIRSERLLMERLDHDLLFRWFVGLGIDDPVWDPSTFSKNRDRLLEGDIAAQFLAALLALPRVKRLLSHEHFSVDGTLIEAWASMKSFKPKDGAKPDETDPPQGRNPEVNFRGERRSNETHASTTDPDARLYRKGDGMEAKLCFMGHALMENRNGLIVDACVTQANGHAERIAALAMIEPWADRPNRITLGADKAFDTQDFVNELRTMSVTPHVAQNTAGRRSAIDGRVTRHAGYALSQRIRKRIEEVFGWGKEIAGLGRTRFRGRERVGLAFGVAAVAYNLVRLPRLLGGSA